MIDIYYVYYSLMSFLKGIGLDSNSSIYNAAFIFGTFILLFRAFRNKYTKKELLYILPILVIGLLDYVYGHITTILLSAITIASAKNIKLNVLIKISFYTRFIGFFLMIVLSSLNVIPTYQFKFWRDDNFIMRYSFGYIHPNAAHMAFAIIVFLILYLQYDKFRIKNAVIIELLNCFLFSQTQSRTGFIILSFGLAFYFILNKSGKCKQQLFAICAYSFVAFLLFSIVISLLYNPQNILWQQMDKLFTGRLFYMHETMRNYGIPLIGHSGYTTSTEQILFDNGYIKLLYEGGLLALIWFCFVNIKLAKIMINRKMEKELFLVFLFNVYSLTESIWASALVNVSLIFVVFVVFQNTSSESNEMSRMYNYSNAHISGNC